MIFVGGPDSGPVAEIFSPVPSLIKLAVAAACCFDPPHEVKLVKAPASKHNFIAPFMERASLSNLLNAFGLNWVDFRWLNFLGSYA
jgi:hypothetical protein